MESVKLGWTNAERGAEGAIHMERLLRSLAQTWDAGPHRQDLTSMNDWIAEVVNKAKGVLRVYGKHE